MHFRTVRARALIFAATLAMSLGALTLGTERSAHAGLSVGVDGGAGFNIGELSAAGIGAGGSLRVGYQLPIPLLRLTPEAQLDYMGFNIEQAGEASEAIETASLRTFSGRGGLRLGFKSPIIGAALYSHIGYGWVTGDGASAMIEPRGLSIDGGIALDFMLIPKINIGLHFGANIIQPRIESDLDSVRWLDAGLHVELVL